MRTEEAMAIIGCCRKTLERYRKKDLLRCTRTPDNKLDYWEEDVYSVVGRRIQARPRRTAVYARVNSKTYRKQLAQQLQNIKHWANRTGIIIDVVHKDLALSTEWSMARRPGIHALIQEMFRKEVSTVVIDSSCRIDRINWPMFEAFCNYCKVELIILNPSIEDPHYRTEQLEDITKILLDAGVNRVADLAVKK